MSYADLTLAVRRSSARIARFVAIVLLGYACAPSSGATLREDAGIRDETRDMPVTSTRTVAVIWSIDLDPGTTPTASTVAAQHWDELEGLVALSEEHGFKLTIYFGPQWAEHVLADATGTLLAQVHDWESRGHELGAHHHSPRHPQWDGYANDRTTYSVDRGAPNYNRKYTGRDVPRMMDLVNAMTSQNGGRVRGGGMTDDSYEASRNRDGVTHEFDGQRLAYRRIDFSPRLFTRPIAGCTLVHRTLDGLPAVGTRIEPGIDGLADDAFDAWSYVVASPAILEAGDGAHWDDVIANVDACIGGAQSNDVVVFGMHPEEYSNDGRRAVWELIANSVLSRRPDGIAVSVETAHAVLGVP